MSKTVFKAFLGDLFKSIFIMRLRNLPVYWLDSFHISPPSRPSIIHRTRHVPYRSNSLPPTRKQGSPRLTGQSWDLPPYPHFPRHYSQNGHKLSLFHSLPGSELFFQPERSLNTRRSFQLNIYGYSVNIFLVEKGIDSWHAAPGRKSDP